MGLNHVCLRGIRKETEMKLYRVSTLLLAGSLFGLAACRPVTSGLVTPAPAMPTIVEYNIPTKGAHAGGIKVGPDGALWFSESGANQIGRITVDGEISEYPVPTKFGIINEKGYVALGPDGAVWFNEDQAKKLGRIAPDGSMTEFEMPPGVSIVREIVAGPDNTLWATATDANKIINLDTDGKLLAEYPLPKTDSWPAGMVLAPDGAFWFVETQADQIGRITMDGKITEYPLPTPGGYPIRITVGPDNALWFGLYEGHKVGRISLDGEITEFDVPGMQPVGLAAGPDGAIWFASPVSGEIGRLTTEGELTKLSVPTSGAMPYHIVLGPDGNLWFTEQYGNKIGQIKLPAASAGQAATAISSSRFKLPMTFAVKTDWTVTEDYSDIVTVRHQPTATEISFNLVTTAEVSDPFSPDGKRIPFPEDFTRWIQEDPDFAVEAPMPVTVAGYSGVQIDVTPTWTSSTAHTKPFLHLKSLDWNLVTDPEKWRFIMLDDVEGERVLVLQILPPDAFEQGTEVAQELLNTLYIAPALGD